MAAESKEARRKAAIKRALALLTEAMDLLDAHGGPAEGAAYLQLAQQKLCEAVRTV